MLGLGVLFLELRGDNNYCIILMKVTVTDSAEQIDYNY